MINRGEKVKIKIIRGVYDFNGLNCIRRSTSEELRRDLETRHTIRDLLTVSEIIEINIKDYLKDD